MLGDVALALAKLGDTSAVEPILRYLTHQNKTDELLGADVRSCAALALGRLKDTRAFEPLLAILEDEADDVRRATAEALGELGDRRAIQPLIEVLLDKNAEVGRSAAEALGKLGDEEALAALTWISENGPGTKSERQWVKEAAEEAIALIKQQNLS